MEYNSVPLDKRIKENIKNYSLDTLFSKEMLLEEFRALNKATGVELFLTDRHGEEAIFVGDFDGFKPDVAAMPGIKIRIEDRTVAHLYTKDENVAADRHNQVRSLVTAFARMLEGYGHAIYRQKEYANYVDELERKVLKEQYQNKHGEREDALTGVFNKNYFDNRMAIIDRSEVVPVGIVNVNINDWKYANDHFGDEESDRLIATVADIIKKESKPEYIIGRVDGDVFLVLIPMAEEEEVADFKERVQTACTTFEDPHLAPSVAVGWVLKTNVEETIEELLSDAEYEMLENKFEIKNAPGYRERLEKAGK